MLFVTSISYFYSKISLANLDETEYLLSSAANAQRLRDALAKIDNGTDTDVAMNIEDIWK